MVLFFTDNIEKYNKKVCTLQLDEEKQNRDIFDGNLTLNQLLFRHGSESEKRLLKEQFSQYQNEQSNPLDKTNTSLDKLIRYVISRAEFKDFQSNNHHLIQWLEIDQTNININYIQLIMKKDRVASLIEQHDDSLDHFKLNEKHLQNNRFTTIGISFNKGMIKQLFDKLTRLQLIIKDKKNNDESCGEETKVITILTTHFQLLEELEPLIANRYRPLLFNSDLSLV
ncbi:hypothetical protein ACTA71_001823 [Dictyostelium dimigraforme]